MTQGYKAGYFLEDCRICGCEFDSALEIQTNAGLICRECWGDGLDLKVCSECKAVGEFGYGGAFAFASNGYRDEMVSTCNACGGIECIGNLEEIQP